MSCDSIRHSFHPSCLQEHLTIAITCPKCDSLVCWTGENPGNKIQRSPSIFSLDRLERSTEAVFKKYPPSQALCSLCERPLNEGGQEAIGHSFSTAPEPLNLSFRFGSEVVR